MGATSVTGVSGAGSVAGKQKGSEHMSLSVKKLIGSHIVAAASQTLTGTTGVIEVPAQSEAITNYVVMLTSNTAVNPWVSTPLAAVALTNTWTFTVTAGSGAVVNWSLVRVGL